MESVLLARTVREEVSDELRNRLMPSGFFSQRMKLKLFESFIFECSSELQEGAIGAAQ